MNGEKKYFYQGLSMLGTFRQGDQLVVRPAVWKKIHPGDVILYRKNYKLEIVHRVVAVEGKCLVTRGDNNEYPDSESVSQRNLIGVVIYIKREGKVYPILGGRLGLLKFFFLRLWIWVKRHIVFVGRYPYRWLRHKQWLVPLWQPRLKKIQLETEHGPLIKYIYRRHTVAIWWPSRHYFECRKPYDLVIPNPEKSKKP